MEKSIPAVFIASIVAGVLYPDIRDWWTRSYSIPISKSKDYNCKDDRQFNIQVN